MNAFDVNARKHSEIGTIQGGAEEAPRGAPAPSPAMVDLEIGGTEIVAEVEIVCTRNADGFGCILHSVENLPTDARFFDPPLAARTVHFGGAAVMVFLPHEDWQNILPTPALEAHLPPAVVVGGLAAHVDHAIDGGAAADHLAARIGEGPAIETSFVLRTQHPVRTRVADREKITHRDMKPDPVVAAAGFQQQHAIARVLAQAIGKNAARRAAADNDVIELCIIRYARRLH